jgi:hypothetical protein
LGFNNTFSKSSEGTVIWSHSRLKSLCISYQNSNNGYSVYFAYSLHIVSYCGTMNEKVQVVDGFVISTSIVLQESTHLVLFSNILL